MIALLTLHVRLLFGGTQIDLRRCDVTVPEVYSNGLDIHARLAQSAGEKHSKSMGWLLWTLYFEAFCVGPLYDGYDYTVFEMPVYSTSWCRENKLIFRGVTYYSL